MASIVQYLPPKIQEKVRQDLARLNLPSQSTIPSNQRVSSRSGGGGGGGRVSQQQSSLTPQQIKEKEVVKQVVNH